MALLLELPLALALIGQTGGIPGANDTAEAAARLVYMKGSVLAYDIRPLDHPEISYKLQSEPVLRFTNPVGRARDGTVFLWLDSNGRPEVAAQVTLNLRGNWVHELTSLSSHPLRAVSTRGPVWSPARGGIELRPIPGAPRPAEIAEQRLAQMRTLCRHFAVEDNFERKSWQPLRLLPQPFARYDSEGTEVVDGVLFCYALTTDPEAYLKIEARRELDGDERGWHYGFAPSTYYPLRALWKGTPVWEHNIESPEGGPNNTLYQLLYSSGKDTEEPKAP